MFNVGDTVRVKDNAYEIKHPGINFADKMKRYCGNEYAIRKVEVGLDGTIKYRLEDVRCDNPRVNGHGFWIFVDEWLEPIKNAKINIEENDFESMFK